MNIRKWLRKHFKTALWCPYCKDKKAEMWKWQQDICLIYSQIGGFSFIGLWPDWHKYGGYKPCRCDINPQKYGARITGPLSLKEKG